MQTTHDPSGLLPGAGSPSPPANPPCRPPRWTWTLTEGPSPPRCGPYHLAGRCYDDHRAAEIARRRP